MKRRFMKNYVIVRNLVANPRTPLDVSLGLMKNLLVQDLRNLSGNKEVSDTVRKLAYEMFKQKTEPQRSRRTRFAASRQKLTAQVKCGRMASLPKSDPVPIYCNARKLLPLLGFLTALATQLRRFRLHAIARLQIIPVNPTIDETLGEKSYPRLEDVPEKIDIVNIFRRPEYVEEIVDSGD